MLGGAIKTTSAPSRRSRTDIAFIAVRVLPVADIILTFVPSVNPARISSMINRNLSLFTCGISLSEMSTIKQLINIKEAAAAFAATASFIGRGDGTRTHGLFVPNEVNSENRLQPFCNFSPFLIENRPAWTSDLP